MLPETAGDGSVRSGAVAYAILAHSDSAQLLRLIRVLRTESPACSVIVHWDGSKEPLETRTLDALGNVHIVTNWVAVEWGGFSLVEATLLTIHSALELIGCEWIVLLSGHDYPLRPVSEIEAGLLSSQVDAYIDVRQVVPKALGRGCDGTREDWLSRRYYFAYAPLPRLRIPLHPAVRDTLARLALWISKRQPLIMIWPMPAGTRWRIGVRRFRPPFGHTRPCRHGSQWLTLSRRAAERVLRRLAEERELVSHFKRTIIPDEAFFQTIMCGESDLAVSQDNRRYEKWIGADPSHPKILRRSDVDLLMRSGKDFARKFQQRVDSSALDEVDRRRTALNSRIESGLPS